MGAPSMTGRPRTCCQRIVSGFEVLGACARRGMGDSECTRAHDDIPRSGRVWRASVAGSARTWSTVCGVNARAATGLMRSRHDPPQIAPRRLAYEPTTATR